MWKYLSYDIFGNRLPAQKVFTQVFIKQPKKASISQLNI